MTEWRPSRPRASFLKRWRLRAFGLVPLAVWGTAIAGTVLLGRTLQSGPRFAGIADSARAAVAAPVDGRIAALLV